jgi:tRNA G46 methylase TrmB
LGSFAVSLWFAEFRWRGDLSAQQTHWERTFAEKVDLFGTEPSHPARKAAALFKKEGASRILELGSGQGRDTLFFASEGFQVY